MKEKNDKKAFSCQGKALANFFNEVAMLQKTPRSGYAFLGTGKESVAEHSFKATVFAYVLATMAKADIAKTVFMCLFHDLAEARTGDFNYVNKMYNNSDEERALKDATKGTGLEVPLLELWAELDEGESLEAKLVADADQLDMLLSLKKELDLGNAQAKFWIENTVKRLKTKLAKELAEAILATHHSEWWIGEGDENWWIKGKK